MLGDDLRPGTDGAAADRTERCRSCDAKVAPRAASCHACGAPVTAMSHTEAGARTGAHGAVGLRRERGPARHEMPPRPTGSWPGTLEAPGGAFPWGDSDFARISRTARPAGDGMAHAVVTPGAGASWGDADFARISQTAGPNAGPAPSAQTAHGAGGSRVRPTRAQTRRLGAGARRPALAWALVIATLLATLAAAGWMAGWWDGRPAIVRHETVAVAAARLRRVPGRGRRRVAAHRVSRLR